MKPVDRSEILDYVTYGEQRDAIRDRALAAKDLRRIDIGEMSQASLHEFIDELQLGIMGVHQTLAQTYFLPPPAIEEAG